MIPKVKITRVVDEDGFLTSITFKSRSLPQALNTAAVVTQALGPVFDYTMTHKIKKNGKHVLTLA